MPARYEDALFPDGDRLEGDILIASANPAVHLANQSGARFDFDPVELLGEGWATTIEAFRVEICASTAGCLSVAWSATVSSPVRSRFIGKADVVWFLTLFAASVPMPRADFWDSFARRCSTRREGRRLEYCKDTLTPFERPWNWGEDVAHQLETCDKAVGRFVHSLNVAKCY